MIKKGKIFLMAVLLLLAFAQIAAAALSSLGPVLPDTDPGPGWSAGYNGFPTWYRDSLGQTVMLSVPPSPLSIPDPVIPGNAFSAQIGFGSEAMYWHSTAIMDGPNGQSLLVLALEAAFGTGDAEDGQQIVFQRVRIRIDAPIAGDYIVTHPYGTKTFTVLPADVGVRAINDTVDIGITSFAAALQGAVGPFLKQVGAPAGTLGDAATPAPVTNGPNGNIFRVQGPGGLDVSTNLFVTGAQLFTGTPFTITRPTFSRDAGGNAAAEVFAVIPAPFVPGTVLKVNLPGQLPVTMRRTGLRYFARVPFTTPFNPNVTVTGTTGGVSPTTLPATLVDVVHIANTVPPGQIPSALYNDTTDTLTLAPYSSDALATLTGSGWVGSGTGVVLTPGAVNTFAGVTFPPIGVTLNSSSGGTQTVRTIIVP